MNRIDKLFSSGKTEVLSLYFTAGHPTPRSVVDVITCLSNEGVNMIEIGIPYSDPLADGPTIQHSSAVALKNGMTLSGLLNQLEGIRAHTEIPLLMMGYLNPIMQYGIEMFLNKCERIGIDGLIVPDLPVDVYEKEFRSLMEDHDLRMVFLITPQTSEERIRMIDKTGSGFIYMVSDASVTGAKNGIKDEQIEYFSRIRDMKLRLPLMIGFGISDASTFRTACDYARGAIIGSAFIKAIDNGEEGMLEKRIGSFVEEIKGK